MHLPGSLWLTSLGFFASALAVEKQIVQGIDLLEIHLPINYAAAKANGMEFVFVKATEGANYRNLRFDAQFSGAATSGLMHGAIHFARCAQSSGADQAKHFLGNGGNWTADGMTLPGVLELEGNIEGKLCHGMSAGEIVSWVREFVETYGEATGRKPLMFLSAKWWRECAGDDASFGEIPLWLANWADEMGQLPVGWNEAMLWQYSGGSLSSGQQDVFLGDRGELERFALGR